MEVLFYTLILILTHVACSVLTYIHCRNKKEEALEKQYEILTTLRRFK